MSSTARDLALIAHCLYCKSLFTQIIDAISLSNFSGQRGKDVLERYYEKVQRRFWQGNEEKEEAADKTEEHVLEFHRVTYLVCPTCLEFCHQGKVYTTIVENAEPDEYFPLSLCEWFKFHADDEEELSEEEKGPPLYINMQSVAGGKPKWELCHGIGAQRLELDSSRSGRVYKNALKQFELTHLDYSQYKPNENIQSEIYRYMIEQIHGCISLRAYSSEYGSLDEILDILRSSKCIFEDYDTHASVFEADARTWEQIKDSIEDDGTKKRKSKSKHSKK